MSRALTGIVKTGYSHRNSTHGWGAAGPWTDLLRLRGTLYRAVTGESPRGDVRAG